MENGQALRQKTRRERGRDQDRRKMQEEDEERLAFREVSERKRKKKKGREKEKEQEGRNDAVRKRTRRTGSRPRSMQSSPIEDALGNCTVIMPEWNRGRGVRGWEECRR